MTMPDGYEKNSGSKRLVSSRSGKSAQIIGILLLIIGGVMLFGALEIESVAASFFGIFLIVISVIIIIRTGRKNEGQTTIELKSRSKAKHGLVLFLYFLAALALCYGLYSEYWLKNESPMESMLLGLALLIVGGWMDEDFGTILWIRDIFSNRKKKG